MWLSDSREIPECFTSYASQSVLLLKGVPHLLKKSALVNQLLKLCTDKKCENICVSQMTSVPKLWHRVVDKTNTILK